jgi:hypothetical protein
MPPIHYCHPAFRASERLADASFARRALSRAAQARIAEIDKETMVEALTLASKAICEAMRLRPKNDAAMRDLLRQSREYIDAALELSGSERPEVCRSLARLIEPAAGEA